MLFHALFGKVFVDSNGDCIQQPGEAGIGGVQIDLFKQMGGTYVFLASTNTAPDGSYGFDPLKGDGLYKIFEHQPAGFAQGGQVAGDQGGNASQQDCITDIPIINEAIGHGYNFCERLLQCVPNTSITSNFNGTTIKAGNTIWFTSVMKLTKIPASGGKICFLNQTITFTSNNTSYTLHPYESQVMFVPGLNTATTSYNQGTNRVETVVPTKFSGNVLLSALAYQVPVDLKGVKNVNWTGALVTNDPNANICINWQWSAAVYSQFIFDYDVLQIKAADDNHLGPIFNSDHAGTPELIKHFVIGGATGGGGSNFTGSLSATKSVCAELCELC